MENIGTLLLDHLPGIVQTLAWGVIAWAWWSLKRVFVRHEDLQELKTEVDARFLTLETGQQDRNAAQEQLQGKLRGLQQRMDNLPTANEVGKILLALEEMRGTQRELMATVNGQAEVLKRIEHPMQLMLGEAIKRGATNG